MRKLKRLTELLLGLLLVFSFGVSFAAAEEKNGNAENLTERCSYSSDLYNPYYQVKLSDHDFESAQTFQKGVKVSLQWTEDVPVKTVAILFYKVPGKCRFLQYDADENLLCETQGSGFLNEFITVESNTKKVTVVPEEEIAICSFYAYGDGTIKSQHDWAPTPEKVDYMVIATHPDDDVLFLGAIVPIYTGEQKYEGTIYYVTSTLRRRKNEAMNGAWAMGLRTMPILGGFRDIPQQNANPHDPDFRWPRLVQEMVRLFREHQPEVVFTHDQRGEYGHWQHIRVSNAVREAVLLAANPEYDPESVLTYGVWEVKKLYLHLYPENKISIPASEPLTVFGGRSAKEVAEEAFLCHESQMISRHRVTDEGVYSLSDFGLAYTTVGYDTEGLNDPFEHIGINTETALHMKVSESIEKAILAFSGNGVQTEDRQ